MARHGDFYLQNWDPTAPHFCCLGHLWCKTLGWPGLNNPSCGTCTWLHWLQHCITPWKTSAP